MSDQGGDSDAEVVRRTEAISVATLYELLGVLIRGDRVLSSRVSLCSDEPARLRLAAFGTNAARAHILLRAPPHGTGVSILDLIERCEPPSGVIAGPGTPLVRPLARREGRDMIRTV